MYFPSEYSVLSLNRRSRGLGVVVDNRRWEPPGVVRRFRDVRGQVAKVAVSLRRPFRVPSALGFVNPRAVVVCVGRKARREVLFAMRKAGRGGMKRTRRRTEASQIHC
ncbi:MAG: hypothetical protein [Microviridae sp. ctQch27]|nr:MAG: hypothetical protein [Microviridae sp. ctQch27]